MKTWAELQSEKSGTMSPEEMAMQQRLDRARNAISLGRESYINEPYTIFDYGKVTVGNYTSIAPHCTFVTGDAYHPPAVNPNAAATWHFGKPARAEPITIGSDVWIGINVTIKGGVTIGHGSIIGMGAVVTKDIDPYSVAFGNPLKEAKNRFPRAIVQRMLKIAWWDWPAEAVQEAYQKGHFEHIERFLEAYGTINFEAPEE